MKREDIVFYSSKKDSQTIQNYIYFDISNKKSWTNLNLNLNDKVIFLSWKNLPNYEKEFHLTENLIESINFFTFLLKSKIKKIIVAGTCYEYGIINGKIKESSDTKPITSYAVAKDTLRSITEYLCKIYGKDYAWIRIFYPYGKGQNQTLNSIIRDCNKNRMNFLIQVRRSNKRFY